MRALALGLALIAAPAAAQEMDHSHHGTPATAPQPAPAAPAPAHEMDHSQHRMPAAGSQPTQTPMPGMDHSAHASPQSTASVEEVIGTAPPPPVPTDHAADTLFPVQRMARARSGMLAEMRFRTSAVMIEQLEYRAGRGGDGYAWEGKAWTGGDIDRLVVTTEGEGTFGEGVESAEVALLWRHALDPWFNLEAGIRHDFSPDPQRSYAVLGIEGLAPYWIEAEAQLFVSNKGDVHARLGVSADQRITNRLILQPSAELDIAFQDVPELGIGGGIEKLELGARLRYEFVPEFAPYIGVHWERRFGQTARYTRMEGERASGVSAVVGVRTWF